MKLPYFILILVTFSLGALLIFLNYSGASSLKISEKNDPQIDDFGKMPDKPHPLSVESLRMGEYPGSDLVLEQELPNGSNYQRKIVSYRSEGLKIYALLTIPIGEVPKEGWPAIIFNHGYIPPAEYRTTERYIAYTDVFSRNGYILLRSDYRGHGNSEGSATGGYGTNDYSIDILNAVSSLKKYPGVNPKKIGMWGHSMGGSITLKNMVVRNDVKAGVIWAGVVASYPDLVERWRRRSPQPSLPGNTNAGPGRGGSWRQSLIESYGQPSDNPEFWNSLSANFYLKDISGPLQLHHGTSDSSVPVEFSRKLDTQLIEAGKTSELYIYEGDDHNLANNLGLALQRSVEFFDKHLKN